MGVITNISFLTLEFDFGKEGTIRSEVFIELEKDGEKSQLRHKLNLQNVSFSDFLSEDSISELATFKNDFSSYIQVLRKLVALKVASDLNLKVADLDYTVAEPLRDKVDRLEDSQEEQDEAIMMLMLGGM